MVEIRLKKKRKIGKIDAPTINNTNFNFFQNRKQRWEENFINITKLSDEYYEYNQKEFEENLGCPTIGYY